MTSSGHTQLKHIWKICLLSPLLMSCQALLCDTHEDPPIWRGQHILRRPWCCLIVGHEAGEEDVQVYQEAVQSGQNMYLSKHTPTGSKGTYNGTPILAVYPPLEQLQQKRLAARRHKTTFAYDFPSVFANALRKIWMDRDASGECDGPVPGMLACPALPCPALPCPALLTVPDLMLCCLSHRHSTLHHS